MKKTPLKQKTPLKRRKPLRAKAIKRAGQPSLTKRGIKTWAHSASPRAIEYTIKYKQWQNDVDEMHDRALYHGGRKFCILCGHTGATVRHHWIHLRSDAPQYKLEPVNGAILCPMCHQKAHAHGRISYNEYRLKIADAFERYGIASKETILAIYDKKWPKRP